MARVRRTTTDLKGSMAKVTLIIEDVKREDGTEVVRVSASSDNPNKDNYTHAEQIGEALLESFGQLAGQQSSSEKNKDLN